MRPVLKPMDPGPPATGALAMLERRERMLGAALSSMADFAYVFDRQHRLLYANQPLLDLWGRTLEETVGRNFADLGYPPELAARLKGQIEEVFVTRRVVCDETFYTNPAGLERSYEYVFSPALAPDGSVDFVVGSTRHITERKSVETALRKSEVEFRMMATAMPQIVWVKRADGHITYFNRQWSDYTGLTLEASLGHEFHKRFHPDDAAHAQAIWEEAESSHAVYSVECRLRRADGEYRWWLIRGVPVKDDAGAVLKWIGTCTDIDELKSAQLEISRTNQELQRQKTELRALFDLVPAMIWFKDTENNILRVNQRVADAAGLSVQEIEGRPAREIYPELSEMLHAEDLEVVRTGKPVLGMMHAAVSRDGREVWVERDKVPYFDESGKVIGIVAMAQNITERKQNAEAIRQSQKRLRDLIDGVGPSIFVALLTAQGTVVEVNRSPLAAAGLTPEDVVGKPFDQTWWWSHSPEARQHLRAAIERAAAGEASRYDVRVRGASDERIDIDFSLQPVRNEAGAVASMVASASIITERKLLETALRESEAEFRTLASAMPQIVWVANPEGQNTYVNSQWTEYSGIDADRSRARGWQDSVHPEDISAMRRLWQEALRCTSTYSVEIRLRRADGEYRWWLVRGMPQLDAAGTPLKWIGTCTDIDELKRAEIEISRANHELKRQQMELRVLFDLTPAMIWFKDTENNILRVNQRVADVAGLTVAEIEGHAMSEIYPRDAAGYFADDLQVIGSGLPKLGIIEQVVDLDDQSLWVQTDKVPYRDEDGKVIGIVVMAQDITGRKQDQDALRDLNTDLEVRVRARTAELNIARDEAERANHAKSAFLAAMSHEIRTPMNGVIGMIEVLHQTSMQGYQVEMIDLIRDSAFALLQIIEDILDFSRIEAGKLDLANEPMRLFETVEKVCAMLDPLAVKRNVRLTTFVDPAIPHTVLGDENRLRQVLINLAGNAIKFSGDREQPGNVSVRVMLASREASALTIEFAVDDDGIGMDVATQARLFVPFAQADASTTRRFGGSGLGLAISDMLVGLMRGTIGVTSTVGRGSTFTVRLPLVAVETGADETGPVAAVHGLRCRIVGADVPLAADLDAHLTRAGMVIEHSLDLAAAAASTRAPGLTLWLILPGPPVPAIAQLRALARDAAGHETRFVVLESGGRQRPQFTSTDHAVTDADSMFRRTLFRVLAQVGGRAHGDPSDEAPPLRHVAPSRADALLRHRLILVAEDNETNRVVILQQLAVIGFAAEVAVDGREALERWRTGDYALLLTDLHMPHLDGYGLTRAIRGEEAPGQRIPIIALTANALRDEELRCLAAGMDAYLSKPVRLAQLRASIEERLAPSAEALVLPAAAAPAPIAATPPADLDVLVALVGDDPAVIEEVLQSFRHSAVESSAALDQAIATDSSQGAADAAHRLKSAARSIGALRVGDLCDEIERAARSRSAGELKALLPLFHAELGAVLKFLDSR